MRKYLPVLLTVLCSYGALYSAAVTAKTVIITTAKPTTTAQFAALELQYHLRLLTGTSIPITSEIPANTQLRIYVGDNPRYHSKDFASQEYLIETGADTVYLCGRDTEDFRKVDYTRENTFPGYWQENGSLYAVYDFLESLGVRWYLPTEIGIAFTPTKNLEIPELKIRRTPTYIYRDTMALNIPTDLCGDTVGERSQVKLLPQRERLLWYLRQRHGGKRMELNHSLYTYYPRFYPTRKELFSQGYEANKDMQLCYTNPEVIAQVVQDARDFFDGKLADASKVIHNVPKDYRSDMYPLGAMDNASWCKCGKCRELILSKPTAGRGFSNNSASNYWFTFVATVANEIKKSHPDKLVGSFAYSSYAFPPDPDKVALPDNVMVRPAMYVLYSYSPEEMAYIPQLLEAWNSRYPHIRKMVSIWYCFPNVQARQQKCRMFPHFSARHVEKYFRWFNEFKPIGMFWEPSYVVGGAGVMFDMVDGYINWKLAWNNELSVEQLFNEFFDKFYGPAAEPMRNFYTMAENTYSDPANYPAKVTVQNSEIAWNRLGTAERMEKLGKLVDEAEKLAVAEPFKTRVALFNNGLWRYMRDGREYAVKMDKLRSPSMQREKVKYMASVDWSRVPSLKLYGGLNAESIPKEADVQVKAVHDGEWIYFAYIQNNTSPERMEVSKGVWANDEWESFFARQRGMPYNQLAVDYADQRGEVSNDGTQMTRWEFPGKIEHVKTANSWTVYLSCRLSDIIPGGIQPGEVLYYNVIRAIRNPRTICVWVPTFADFCSPDRFGELYLEPVKP